MESIFEENPLDNPVKGGWNLISETWEEFTKAITIQSLLPKYKYEGVVYEKNQQGQLSQFYAVITNEIFYFVESQQNKQPIKWLNLKFRRIDIIIFQSFPGLQIIGRKLVYEILFPNWIEFERWYELFVEYCIQLNIEKFYIKEQNIGKGNYAKVYLGREIKSQEQIAIKAIKKSRLRQSKRNVSAIINEIEGQRCIRHPYICTLYGVFEDKKKVYMIVEYCEGGELFKRILKRKKFSEAIAAKFAKNMLECFVYLHECANVVHRDIKPENILMVNQDNDYNFKLADFGLSMKFDPENPNLTAKCGSPGYVAPEILNNRPYGPKADLFSLGVILYILLVGRQPFFGKNPQEVIMQNKQCKISFQAKFWQNISKDAMHLVVQLTDPDQKSRPQARQALLHKWFQKENTIKHKFTPANEIETPLQVGLDPLTPGETPCSKLISREKIAKQLETEGNVKFEDLIESPMLPNMQPGTPVMTPVSSNNQSQSLQQQSAFSSFQNQINSLPTIPENADFKFESDTKPIRKFSLHKYVLGIYTDLNEPSPSVVNSSPKNRKLSTNLNVFTKVEEEENRE